MNTAVSAGGDALSGFVLLKINDDGTMMLETSPGRYIKIEKSAISMEWTQNINKPVVALSKRPTG